MIRLQDNPPVSWPEDVLGSDNSLPWTAAYCKPRQEKALARDLLQKQIPYFLPMVLKETSFGGRRRQNLHPLFPSYLFLAVDKSRQLEALRTDRIVKFLSPQQGGETAFRAELNALGVALRNFPRSLELQPRLTLGVPVRIRSGPMAGIEGIIMQIGSRHKLWMGVSCLGVGATVEIHPDLVEPI